MGQPSAYLLAEARLFVFGTYGVQDWNDVWRAVCKIGRTGDGRLMDVHGVRVLKDGEAEIEKEKEKCKYSEMYRARERTYIILLPKR